MFRHPSGEILEAYILGRLPGQQTGWDDDPELVAIETHLLFCSKCVEAAELFEATARGIREVLGLADPHCLRKPKVFTAGGSSE